MSKFDKNVCKIETKDGKLIEKSEAVRPLLMVDANVFATRDGSALYERHPITGQLCRLNPKKPKGQSTIAKK